MPTARMIIIHRLFFSIAFLCGSSYSLLSHGKLPISVSSEQISPFPVVLSPRLMLIFADDDDDDGDNPPGTSDVTSIELSIQVAHETHRYAD